MKAGFTVIKFLYLFSLLSSYADFFFSFSYKFFCSFYMLVTYFAISLVLSSCWPIMVRIQFSMYAWSAPSFTPLIPSKNYIACWRTFLRSGSRDIASYNLAPKSQISLAWALCDLRLATLAGRVNAAAYSSSVAFELEAFISQSLLCREVMWFWVIM